MGDGGGESIRYEDRAVSSLPIPTPLSNGVCVVMIIIIMIGLVILFTL